MDKRQRDKLAEVKEKATYSALTPSELTFLFSLITDLDDKIKARNEAIVTLNKKCKTYDSVIQKQDEAISRYQERVLKLYGGEL